MKISEYISLGLKDLDPKYVRYVKKRGVNSNTSLDFYSWVSPAVSSPCKNFSAQFGRNGEKLRNFMLIPVYSLKGKIIGFEARSLNKDGSKFVRQYRTPEAQWSPYFLNAKTAVETLWQGGDIWVVEGLFDLTALESVVPSCDTVISTLRAGMDSNSFETICRFYSKISTIYFVYDNDETGRKKSEMLCNLFNQRGVRAVNWKYRGKDPNEVLCKGGLKTMKRMFL